MGNIITPDQALNTSSDELLQARAVNDAGYDKTKDSRVAPEVRITKIHARCGSVVIVGEENKVPTEKQITIDEAILRCKALLEMAKNKQKYRSDMVELHRLLNMFVGAIESAKMQLTSAGFPFRG